ncbi:MAG TPA: hypothetical protein HPP83_07785 [Candidatus Hydrogenedentes bacterium]|nr:hypothetical protein [Candidatus Hydrogenedentota bacterium]
MPRGYGLWARDLFAGVPRWLKWVVILAWLLTIVLGIAVVLPMLATVNPQRGKPTCSSNLKQLGVIFKMYANENENYFAPMDPEHGCLLFDRAVVYPDYLTDSSILLCPQDEQSSKAIGRGPVPLDDHSYIYLGYMLTSEQDGLAFLEAYRKRAEAGLSFDGDLEAPPGSAPFRRLRENVPNDLPDHGADASPQTYYHSLSTVPVMFDRLGHHHAKRTKGANVLYMDGHVEFVRMNQKFPITQKFLDAIEELEKEFQ